MAFFSVAAPVSLLGESASTRVLPPLPAGEGWGEGELFSCVVEFKYG
jgi:hypothetical protein